MCKPTFRSFFLSFKTHLIMSLLLLWSSGCSNNDPSFSLTSVEQSLQQGVTVSYTSKVDVLWVIDNSGSMKASQEDLANNFNSFISNFTQKDLDFQMAVTSTDAYQSNSKYSFSPTSEYSLLKTGDGKVTDSGFSIINPSTNNLEDVFLTNIKLGTSGNADERAFSSIEETLKNTANQDLFRKDSFLAIIIVSDEDDYSRPYKANREFGKNLYGTDRHLSFLDEFTGSTADERKYSVSSIHILTGDNNCLQKQRDAQPGEQGQRYGARYENLVSQTQGKNISLCSDFSQSLDILSKEIIESTLVTSFVLERKPLVDTISVVVNGNIVAKSVDGSDGWEYVLTDDGKNLINFIGEDAAPPAGAKIDISFSPETFKD